MNTSENKEAKVLQVAIEDIMPNRAQPRLVFDDQSLQELAESIKQHGIIQPLVLRKNSDKYEIIAGERRYRAAKIAGLASVPAIISNMSDSQSAEVAIVENIQRKDLTAIEEARSYKTILDTENISQEDLAKRLGVSQSAISNKLRLLSLDNEVQNAVLENKISERHARSLLKLNSKEDQKTLLKKIIDERLTVKQLEGEIKKLIGDVPLVKNELNIEEIKANSQDINPFQAITSELNKNEENPEEKKFFNFLEESAVNMDVPEEKPIANPTLEPPTIKDVQDTLLKSQDEVEREANGSFGQIFDFIKDVPAEEEKRENPAESPVESLDAFEQQDNIELLDEIGVMLSNNEESNEVKSIRNALVGKSYTISETKENNKRIIRVELDEN